MDCPGKKGGKGIVLVGSSQLSGDFSLLLADLVDQLLGASDSDVAKGIGISLVLHFIVPFWF